MMLKQLEGYRSTQTAHDQGVGSGSLLDCAMCGVSSSENCIIQERPGQVTARCMNCGYKVGVVHGRDALHIIKLWNIRLV